MESEAITYITEELSFFKRLWITSKLPPRKNTQLKQITFLDDNVSITMRSGNTYELKKGEYKTTETLFGILENSYNIKIITLTKPIIKIIICGFDGELTPKQWQDIKARLNYKKNGAARNILAKGLEITGDLMRD